MLLPKTLPGTEFKKDYKFIWTLLPSRISTLGRPFKGIISSPNDYFVLNTVNMVYISQLAESVQLPNDEINVDDSYLIGGIKYPIAKFYEMPSITVTYLDDSIDSVYKFHKTWQKLLIHRDGVYFSTLKDYAIKAEYITFDDSLSSAEYVAYKALHDNNIPMPPGFGIKPSNLTEYPFLFPRSISRGTASHSSENLSKVTVTYVRIPDIKRSKAYTRIDDIS